MEVIAKALQLLNETGTAVDCRQLHAFTNSPVFEFNRGHELWPSATHSHCVHQHAFCVDILRSCYNRKSLARCLQTFQSCHFQRNDA